MTRIHVAEYLDLDVGTERWHCHSCGHDIAAARDNYKTGLLLTERDPSEVHPPLIEGRFTFAPDETEYLPPGHPITHDTEIDIDALKRRLDAGELRVDEAGKLATRNDSEVTA
jgi:acetone carboxylase, gamma subunit